jgi:hypothetical protein
VIRPRLLLASAVAAVAPTALLGVVLELATRPEPPTPKRALTPTPIQPKAVRTESFTRPAVAAPVVAPTPVPPPPLLVEAPKELPKAAPVALVVPKAPDLCARHKLRKVYTRSGRSWRCRR